MDPQLLEYYNRELRFMREMGAEFATEFPKIAGRLGLEGFDCADPYVERLLEGFAFMAARVQLKVDAEFPTFTQHLLEIVQPNFTAPTPAMVIAQFEPNPAEGDLSSGFVIERGSSLRGKLAKDYKTRCEFTTCHDVNLWPIEVSEVEYFATRGAVRTLELDSVPGTKAAIKIRLKTLGEIDFSDLSLDQLTIHLRGSEDMPGRLYEQIIGNGLGFAVRSVAANDVWLERHEKQHIEQVGFDDDEAILPADVREFRGYRLLHEYFVFPERFLFVNFTHLQSAISKCHQREIEIIVFLDRSDTSLERIIDKSHFALHCAPAVNLFERRADRIHIDHKTYEYHVVPDRTRPAIVPRETLILA